MPYLSVYADTTISILLAKSLLKSVRLLFFDANVSYLTSLYIIYSDIERLFAQNFGLLYLNKRITTVSKKKKNIIHENVTITALAAEGKALGKVDDMVIFVTNAIPGDVVDILVLKKRKSYCEGKIMAYKEYSKQRTEPFCSHFGSCGGCKWQILPYAGQLAFKQQQVADQFRRIGHLEYPEILPIAACSQTEFYRNKLEFSFSNSRWITEAESAEGTEITERDALGFHVPGRFDKIVDISKCYLQPDPSNQIRNAIKAHALKHGLEFYDIRNQSGFLRNVIVRTASTGEIMVVMSLYREDTPQREALLDMLKDTFPQISSLMYVINSKANDTITDQDVITYSGRDYIEEEMEGLRFKIGPKSFYQTNSAQAYELYKITRSFAALTGDEVVYDLYTGTGTIANFVAKQAKKVVGIEYVPEAIEDAFVNSSVNGIENTSFFAGDMKNVLSESFIAEHGRPDVMIIDPPRAGMHEDVIKTIIGCLPQRIVYVSCNPATQARDLALMAEHYAITAVQPVDMFPHTHHVENVVKLELK